MSQQLSEELLPITHVAIRFDGKLWSLPRPFRHHHILRTIMFLSKEFGEWTGAVYDSVDTHGEDQGFLDSSGKYLTRREAMLNAKANGQITKPGHPTIEDVLYSEDLW